MLWLDKLSPISEYNFFSCCMRLKKMSCTRRVLWRKRKNEEKFKLSDSIKGTECGVFKGMNYMEIFVKVFDEFSC